MPLPCLVQPECFWKCSFPFDLSKHNTRLLKYFLRENIFNKQCKKVEHVPVFYRKCRKFPSLMSKKCSSLKSLKEIHLQSSLGRGKSWTLPENISSQTGKKIFQVQRGKYFRSRRHLATCVRPRQTVATRQGLQTGLSGKIFFSLRKFVEKNLTKNMFDNCTAK